MSELLRTESLKHRFAGANGPVEPLRNVNLTVNSGQFVVVTGRSGAGKTTLLLACAGMRRPTDGTVRVTEHNIYALPPRARIAHRAETLGFVFQTLQLVPYLSLWNNVMLAPRASKHAAERWVEQLGLSDRRSHLPRALSQGERQRAALARALVHGPQLVLADEPTGNLDAESTKAVLSALQQFADEGGGVLVASHDGVLAEAASVVYQLESGVVTEMP